MENKTLTDAIYDRIVKKFREKNFSVETGRYSTVVCVPCSERVWEKVGWPSANSMLFGGNGCMSVFKCMAEWKKLPRNDSRNFLYRELSKALPGVEEIYYIDVKTPEELDTWLGLYGV